MSGPITASFSFGPLGAVILAAEAIREVQAMGQEYEAAFAHAKERERILAAARRGQRQAVILRKASLLGEADRLERRLERLQGICRTLSETRPQAAGLAPAHLVRPTGDQFEALAQYSDAMRQEIQRVQRLLAEFGGRQRGAQEEDGEQPRSADLDELLGAYAYRRSLSPGLTADQAKSFEQTAARILGRLELPAGGIIPRELEILGGNIVLAPTLERAEELAAELRLRVQAYRTERARSKQDASDAAALLEALPDDMPTELRDELERAAAGAELLGSEIRASAQRLLAATRDAYARQEQEAAAIVLEQSLRDLGYQVDDVEHTLFVEGGMIHFQRKGWEDYFVRMRLDSDERTLNFNIVRPVGGEESEMRRRMDAMAEDRWCSEFPQLLKTLAARGFDLKVARQLGAGELPVQLVAPDSLPVLEAEDANWRAASASPARLLP